MNLRALERRHKHCCGHHLPFKTLEAAEGRLATLRSRPKMKDPERLVIYTCLACGKYHCGHKPKYEVSL